MYAIIQHTCSLYNIYCLCYWTLNHLVHIIIWLWYSGRKYDDMREYMEFKMFIVSNQLSLVIKNWNFKQALLTISLYFNQGQLFINTFSFLTFSTFIHFIFLFFFFDYNFLFFFKIKIDNFIKLSFFFFKMMFIQFIFLFLFLLFIWHTSHPARQLKLKEECWSGKIDFRNL